MHRQDIALLFFARRAHAAQDGLDTRLDFQNVERLGHIIVRAVFQAEDLIHIFALCGEHDDGHVGFLTDALTDFDPVHHRQHHVQQDQINVVAAEFFKRFRPVVGGQYLVSVLFQ